MALITVEQAEAHLRLDLARSGGSPDAITDERLPDLEMKIDAASAIVLDYLKYGDSPEWTPHTVPKHIAAAALLVLSALWEDREGTGIGDYLKPDGAIANLLRRSRDPALA